MNENRGYDLKMLRAVNPTLSTEKYRCYINILLLFLLIIIINTRDDDVTTYST